ncbi:tryptophan-rich sensory protein [Dyadobacter pollutisoli]|uniref:Tryptophan-rich sensory protein n=1 Tax=Dyadobacter pollutisoli TaxID=2910158 RepID=A0A9E8N9Y4_9BACT|nr:tryptophan-rich sensory protein [Dyadobacter pollutisoli]WAC12620.1 tryptophan-rich sensory protein [Dyadobacter pollutisoli]
MKKTLQIANILALIITLIVNYLSNTGIFNGNTMATVSARYQNFFTPSGYAFSVWGLIYLALAAFVIYQSRGLFNDKPVPTIVEKIGWLFVISCAANSLWVFAWLYDYTGLSVIIMAILLSSLLLIVFRTRMEMDVIPIKKIALTWWPFALYLGWITVAIIANFAAYLTKIQWNGFGLADTTWTIIMLCAAGVIFVGLTWVRNLRESSLVGIWGLVAVAVANWNQTPAVAYTAIAVSAVIFLSSMLHAYRNRGRHFLEEARWI